MEGQSWWESDKDREGRACLRAGYYPGARVGGPTPGVSSAAAAAQGGGGGGR